jgi:hypothetical protein
MTLQGVAMKYLIAISLLMGVGMSQVQAAQEIEFSEIFEKSIVEGKKKATMRMGHFDGKDKKEHYKAGSATIRFTNGKKMPMKITKVVYTTFDWKEGAVTPAVLAAETVIPSDEAGFHRLYKGMKRWYPDFKYGDKITIVYFDLVKK